MEPGQPQDVAAMPPELPASQTALRPSLCQLPTILQVLAAEQSHRLHDPQWPARKEIRPILDFLQQVQDFLPVPPPRQRLLQVQVLQLPEFVPVLAQLLVQAAFLTSLPVSFFPVPVFSWAWFSPFSWAITFSVILPIAFSIASDITVTTA